jgi:hypothetical protein
VTIRDINTGQTYVGEAPLAVRRLGGKTIQLDLKAGKFELLRNVLQASRDRVRIYWATVGAS